MMSVMIGGVTERLAPDSNFMEPTGVNDSLVLNVTLRDAERVRVAAAVTLLSGIFQVRHGSCSKKKNSIGLKLVLECLICHRLPAGSARPGPVWLRGDLPVGATGARLYHGCCYPCHRVPAQVHLWHQPRPIQWTHCTDLCEEELRPEDSQLHAALVHCRMTILIIRHMAALHLTPSSPPCLFLQTVLEICHLLPQTNIGTLVVSIVTIVCLIIAKEINAYLTKKIPVPIPVELLAVSMTHKHGA